jgi:hypothetical protein
MIREIVIMSLFAAFLTAISILILRLLIRKFPDNRMPFIIRCLIYLLLLWSVLGFFTNLDYSQQCGDIIFSTPILKIYQIFYSTISILLLSACLIFVNARRTLLIIETLYWIFKLILLKSGYNTGWGIDLFIFSYDFIGLLLRVCTISLLFNKIKIGIYLIPVFSAGIILVKSFLFDCQNDFVSNKVINSVLSQRLIPKFKGEWVGTASWKIGVIKTTPDFEFQDTTKVSEDELIRLL